jgi:hypothetical protein
MAAPNLLSLTTVTAKTAVQQITTSATAIVTNSAASGKAVKIVALYISNVNGASAADVTIDVYRSTVAYKVGSTISVPADSTLDLINKVIYLEEGDSLRLTASVNSYLEAVCSYEELS